MAGENVTKRITSYFRQGLSKFGGENRVRIGAELKLPLVRADGSAASREDVTALWQFLIERGWNALTEADRLIGATCPGELNETVGSSETGYCKVEFSLAHVANLHDLSASRDHLLGVLQVFTEETGLHFLGCGIHPVTPPSAALRMKKERSSVWEHIYRSNEIIPTDQGDDMDLFTVNAGSHVHVSLSPENALAGVNVLNGFAPAQIALNGNASVWRGEIDPDHHSVSEAFWDWWKPAEGRVGIPEEPFRDLAHYADAIAQMDLLYVKRKSGALTFSKNPTLAAFLGAKSWPALSAEGQSVEISPEWTDLDLHNSCYWYNARISRYFTVENRVNDQQPPSDLLVPALLTTGLTAALPEAMETLKAYSWPDIVKARADAYRHGLSAQVGPTPVARMAKQMLEVARLGLERRGLDEAVYLLPLQERLSRGLNPSAESRRLVAESGLSALIEARTLASSS